MLVEDSLQNQVSRLQQEYEGLSVHYQNDKSIMVCGLVSFEASYPEKECISDCFKLEIEIPRIYPDDLPVVKETNGRINSDYEHLNDDESFCLAVPLEKKAVYDSCPTLLGFLDNLVIPYLYSFCYWEKYSEMPYGEMSHGVRGLRDYYLELFASKNPAHTFKTLSILIQKGYDAHVPCACGSGKKTCKCHKTESKLIAKSSNREQVASDLYHICCTYYQP